MCVLVGYWVGGWDFVRWGDDVGMCVFVVVCGGVDYVWVCGRGILNLVRLRRRPNFFMLCVGGRACCCNCVSSYEQHWVFLNLELLFVCVLEGL